jgi:hypothetical protein
VEVGAKVYFVYNNPDDILCPTRSTRSREIIESRGSKINSRPDRWPSPKLHGCATSIQLAVLLTILEMVLRDLMKEIDQIPNVRSPLHLTACHRSSCAALPSCIRR